MEIDISNEILYLPEGKEMLNEDSEN